MFAMIPRVVKTALSRSGSTPSASVARASVSSVLVRSVSTLVSSAPASASTTSTRSTRTTTLSSSRLAFLGLLAASGFAVLSNMSSTTTELSAAPSTDATGLKPDAFTPFKVKSVTQYNHDSVVVTLALASPDAFLELPVSSFVMAKFTNAEGKDVVRPYTPLTATSKGELQLLVKVYANSQMGAHVANLKPGDTLALKGPMKKLQYVPNGKREVALVAGGSGITPMIQVMDKIASNPQDKTKVTLLFANKTPQDILLREQIDAIAKKHSNVKVVYFVDKEPFADGEVGHINAAKLKQYLPAPGDDVMIYVCGPQPFYAAISGTKAPDYTQGELSGALLELGYTKDMVFKV